jgi:hypothetical protein
LQTRPEVIRVQTRPPTLMIIRVQRLCPARSYNAGRAGRSVYHDYFVLCITAVPFCFLCLLHFFLKPLCVFYYCRTYYMIRTRIGVAQNLFSPI